MKAALQFYTGTSEEWESINPKPYDAVWCIEVLSGGRRLLKIGNGNDRWNDLEYMDESYIKGLPENLDELAASIADERARAQIEEGRLQGAIEAETERAAGAEQANALAAAAAQQTADDNNLLSGALAGDVETLKITLTKSEGSTIDISLADLETLFLRRSAAHDNGATSIGNEPGNDGFSLRSTEDDTNSAGGIETNTAAGNPLAAGMYLKHNVNADDNVRVLLLNNGTTKRAYLLKDKAVPLTRGEVDPDDELWNKKEIQNAINDAIAGFSTGLKMPVSLDMESHLPDPATAETGDYYRISNMDVSMPGQSGEAWFNPDISTTAWQKTINAAFAPDNTTLELNGDGQLAIKADVQALIDGAVQEEQVVTTPVTGSATDTEVLSAKNVFDHILGEAVAALRDGFATKRVVPALNQLFDEAGKIKKPFTYLVDSDEALADWANNVRTDGQDYTAVLIAPGTWTSAVEVNLTTSGTKVVVGMPGSTLSFTSRYGLRYTTLPTTTDYRMEGVKVEVNPSPTSGDFAGAFAYCANLTGCTGAVTTAGTNLEAAPFAYCVNLTGCTGTAHGEGVGIGFSNCAILTACTGTGTGEEIGYGFYSCRGMLQNQPGDTPSTTAAYGSCYVSISGSGPAPSDTALGGWNKGAGAPTDPLPVANGGTGADTAAQARVNLGIEGGISQFTYLVDSDEALADWANNVRTDGQDYTAVLIAPGTWTSAVEVNLTTSGTKVVVGMPGSTLSFTSRYGLRYTSRPTTTDYRMEGVNITLAYDGTSAAYAFHSCTNLTNCTGTATTTTATNAYAFYNCTNLTNCTATAVTGSTSNPGIGFQACINLTNCTATTTSNTTAYAFYGCNYLTNCTANLATSTSQSTGFYSCSYLTNCYSNIQNTTAEAYGFRSCNYLTNCYSYISPAAFTAASYGFYGCNYLANCYSNCQSNNYSPCAFYSCTHLTDCRGIGQSSASQSFCFLDCTSLTGCRGKATGSAGYAFQSCKGMLLNYPDGASTSGTYQSCYVSLSGSGTAPADTAAGGWNKV